MPEKKKATPNGNWKDYQNNSELILVFGKIDAKVYLMNKGTGNINTYGIICHPFQAWQVTDTLANAKVAAEVYLTGVLNTALAGLT